MAIDCPGEPIVYNCSIQSNTEDLHLTWHITIPGMILIDITYDNTSNLDRINSHELNISSTLTRYGGEFIESIIILTVLNNLNSYQVELNCSIADLDNATEVLYVDYSGKWIIFIILNF